MQDSEKQRGYNEAREGIYNPPHDIEARKNYEQGRAIVEEERQRRAYHDTVVNAASSASNFGGSSSVGTDDGKGKGIAIAFAIIYIPVIFFSAFMRDSGMLQPLGIVLLIPGIIIAGLGIFWAVKSRAYGFVGFLQGAVIWLGVTTAISGITMWLMGMGVVSPY